ncbi:MAG: type II toxin-antitoxin system Phd/YefM family antitoxin [Fibromonadaceae bacterium]|jgi:prevent-host-death family protein|nr:type II toxin-antitoxin system Phd/YefM family antitoxin [Fibromonadaceae bacterium]
MQRWQLQEAKAKFSELVKQTTLAPQSITLRGEPVAVVISIAKYKQLTKPKKNLFDMLRSAPISLADLDLPSRKDIRFRKIEL